MADEKRNADSLGIYLTGAGHDGGSQPDPGHSLGEYRSLTEAATLGVRVADPIAPLVIERALPAIGEGVGYLRGDLSGHVYYTPPGGVQSAAYTIADGETKLLEPADPDEAIRVSRTGGLTLYGSMSLTFVEHVGAVFAGPDLSNTERVAGADKYRGVMLRAHGIEGVINVALWIATLGTQRVSDGGQLGAAGTGTITTTGSFADWPDVGFCRVCDNTGTLREIVYYSERTATVLTISDAAHRGLLGTSPAAGAATDTVDAVPGIRIALEAPDAAGKIQTIADEDTAPGGVSWSTGITESTGLSIPVISPAKNYGLWIHRQFPAGGEAAAELRNAIDISFYGARQAG